jgi:hypothetical protein
MDANHLVRHGDHMLLGPLRIPKKGVRDPQQARHIAIQNKGLKGIIVTKAFIIPGLVEDDVNGILLVGRTENHTLGLSRQDIHVQVYHSSLPNMEPSRQCDRIHGTLNQETGQTGDSGLIAGTWAHHLGLWCYSSQIDMLSAPTFPQQIKDPSSKSLKMYKHIHL